MVEHFDPDEWVRLTPRERDDLRDTIRYRLSHDKRLEPEKRRELTRLSAGLISPPPIKRDLGEK